MERFAKLWAKRVLPQGVPRGVPYLKSFLYTFIISFSCMAAEWSDNEGEEDEEEEEEDLDALLASEISGQRLAPGTKRAYAGKINSFTAYVLEKYPSCVDTDGKLIIPFDHPKVSVHTGCKVILLMRL